MIIKHKEPCSKALGLGLKNVNCPINLLKQFIGCEIAISIFPCLKQKPCFSERQYKKVVRTRHLEKNLLIPINEPSPFKC